MKIVTGKEMLETFEELRKEMDALEHLAKMEVPCAHCNGTGWTPAPPSPSHKESRDDV